MTHHYDSYPNAVVTVDEKVARYEAVCFHDGRACRGDALGKPVVHAVICKVRLPVPAVKGSMIACLSHLVEHQIAFHKIVPSKAIVEIDAGTRAVVADVINKRSVGGQRLKVATRLLAVDPKVVNVVVCNSVLVGVGRSSPVDAISRP